MIVEKVAKQQICFKLCSNFLPIILLFVLFSFFFIIIPISESYASLLTMLISLLSTMFLITLAKKKGSPDENLVQHNLQECDQLELQPSLGDVTHTEITKEKETSKRNDEKAEAPFPPLNSESSNCSILYKFFEHNDHHKNEQHADLVSDFSLPSDSKISAGSIMGESFEIDDVVEEEDSLIEIKLPSSHLNGLIEDAGPQRKMESNLTVFLPESIFKQQGLLELLAEINEMNEDDSLIEIDISMGSSKC